MKKLYSKYRASGPKGVQNVLTAISYSPEYRSTSRKCNELPSSLQRMFATAESADEQQKGKVRKGRKNIN